jgi:hypothetical protein
MTEIFLLNHNYYTDPLVRSISQWLPYLRHDLGMVASAQLVFFLPCQKKLAAADRSGNFIVRSIRRIQRASTHRLVIAAWVTVVVLSYDGCLIWSLFNYYAHQHRYDHAYKRCKKSASLMTPYQRRGYIRNVSPVSFIYQIHNKNNLQEFWGRPPADPSETQCTGDQGYTQTGSLTTHTSIIFHPMMKNMSRLGPLVPSKRDATLRDGDDRRTTP